MNRSRGREFVALAGALLWLLAMNDSARSQHQRAEPVLSDVANTPAFARHDLQRLPPIDELPPLEALPTPPLGDSDFPPAADWCQACGPCGFEYHFGGRARGYYINDQRIEFTGHEATFAVEGVLDGGISQCHGEVLFQVETELFVNQPFDRNFFVNTPERQSFARNFDIEPLQISQLYLATHYGDWTATLGRFVTPFGRFYYPIYRNNFDDSPFIRSEAILYRETGVLLDWNPPGWNFAAALTNGGPEQDANSSKALVARGGIDRENFALGASAKIQDGIGSETSKVFNEHYGLDAMIRRGNWMLSGEAIYDHYGLRRPGTALDDIFWGRSLYYRDLNDALAEPITGFGYYVNLGYEGERWSLMLNYGEFYPEELGIEQHDTPTRRGLIKASRHWTPNFETYGVLAIENDLPNSFDNSTRRGVYLIFGGQFVL